MMISEARRSSCMFKRRARTQAALGVVYRSRQCLQMLSSWGTAILCFSLPPFVLAGHLSCPLTISALDHPQGGCLSPVGTILRVFIKTMTASAEQYFVKC